MNAPHENSRPETGVEGLICLVGYLSLIPYIYVKAFVLQHLWKWFITPTFNIIAPSIIILVGIGIIISYLQPLQKFGKKDAELSWGLTLWYEWAGRYLRATFVFCFGYFIMRLS